MEILNRIRKEYLFFPLLFIGIFILYTILTRWGAVVGFDSYYYLRAAEGLKSGIGLGWLGPDGSYNSLIHYPPLYSAVVAGLSWLTHGSILQAARWVAVLTSALFFTFLAIFVYRTSHSWSITILGSLFLIFSAQMLSVLTAAMSEGLFFVLFAGFLLAAQRYLSNPNRRDLLVCGVLTAGMLLTRYAAAAVFITVILVGFINRKLSVVSWIKEMVLYTGVSILPVVLWMTFGFSNTGSFLDRSISYHPAGKPQYDLAVRTITEWFLPNRNKMGEHTFALLAVVVFLVCLAVMLIFRKQIRKDVHENLNLRMAEKLLGMYILIYPIFLWFSYAFMDASTRWNARILSPWLISICLLMIIIAARLHDEAKTKLFKWIIFCGLTVWALAVAYNGRTDMYQMVINGDGFTDRVYQKSEFLQRVRQLPANSLIYTNNVPLIYFNSSHNPESIPEKENTIQDKQNADYSQHMDTMKTNILSGKAYLVVFRPYDDKDGVYPTIDELTVGLTNDFRTKEGFIFLK